MNEIVEVFNSVEFESIRTAKINNDIYFVGKDVAEEVGKDNSLHILYGIIFCSFNSLSIFSYIL